MGVQIVHHHGHPRAQDVPDEAGAPRKDRPASALVHPHPRGDAHHEDVVALTMLEEGDRARLEPGRFPQRARDALEEVWEAQVCGKLRCEPGQERDRLVGVGLGAGGLRPLRFPAHVGIPTER